MAFIEFPHAREEAPTRRLLFLSDGGYKGGFEFNVIGLRWNLRIARHQVALWYKQYAIVMWLAGEGVTGVWKPWNRPGYRSDAVRE